jgi:hypothetical protein
MKLKQLYKPNAKPSRKGLAHFALTTDRVKIEFIKTVQLYKAHLGYNGKEATKAMVDKLGKELGIDTISTHPLASTLACFLRP